MSKKSDIAMLKKAEKMLRDRKRYLLKLEYYEHDRWFGGLGAAIDLIFNLRKKIESE